MGVKLGRNNDIPGDREIAPGVRVVTSNVFQSEKHPAVRKLGEGS